MCGRLERIQRCDKSNKRVFTLPCRESSCIKNCGPDYVFDNGSIRLVKVRVTRAICASVSSRASPFCTLNREAASVSNWTGQQYAPVCTKRRTARLHLAWSLDAG